ncbi:nucleotide exchange factor GrpE [Lactobacillus sp. A27]|uniref:nucleotide exchange factor GrpE n=1 Tax=Lactobacillus sp. A27 TaxID=2796363 RepID=UPI00191EC20A|nr:nucleotide exchange factor GrpE [Lactobacillus sp. A27]MBL1060830.1 nucleotide exchange factor GrpE [Lactobacillus sp. A27]
MDKEEKDTTSKQVDSQEQKATTKKEAKPEASNKKVKKETVGTILSRQMSELKDLFNQKIANDKHKDQLFDKMHAELVKYQQGSIDKMIDDMAMDVILLSDNTKQVIDAYKDSEPTKENYIKLLNQFQGISDELEDILFRQGIEPYTVEDDEFDPKKQRVIGKVTTDKKELNNKVASKGVVGYEKDNGQVLRRENVNIYKYQPEKSPSKED